MITSTSVEVFLLCGYEPYTIEVSESQITAVISQVLVSPSSIARVKAMSSMTS